MANKRYVVELTREERDQLEALLKRERVAAALKKMGLRSMRSRDRGELEVYRRDGARETQESLPDDIKESRLTAH